MKLLLSLVIGFVFVFGANIGKVVKIKGEVFSDGHKLKLGDKIQDKNSVKTKKNGWVMIEQPSGNIIKISSNSNIKFNSANKITQNKGRVFVKVNKNSFSKALAKGLPRFTVKTKTATMGIRGTNFVVDLNSNKEKIMLRNGDLTVNANKGTFNYFKSEMLAEIQAMKDEFKAYKKQIIKEFKAYKESFAGYKPQPPTKKVKMKPRRVIVIDPLKNNLFEDNFSDNDDNEFGEFDNFGGFKTAHTTNISHNKNLSKHKNRHHKQGDSFNSNNDPDFMDSKIDKELDF